MALWASTGFENVYSNNSDHNTTTDKAIQSTTAMKPVLNGLYFKEELLRVGQCQGRIFNWDPGSSFMVSNMLATWTPNSQAVLDSTVTTNGRGGSIGHSVGTVTPSLRLAASAFTDGVFCSYATISNKGAGAGSGGEQAMGAVEHRGKWYGFLIGGSNLETANLIIADITSAVNADFQGDWTIPNAKFQQASQWLNSPNSTSKGIRNEIKFGITSTGVLKFRMNDVEVQANVGGTWSPVASSAFIISGMGSPTFIGAVNGVVNFSCAVDDLTINDGSGSVDNDLPPMREGYGLTRPQDHGNFLFESDIAKQNQWYAISAQSTVDYTNFGAPNNSVGTLFQVTSAITLGSGDILQERFCSINLPGRNDPVPVGASTNEDALLDYDTSTYSKFFRNYKFGLKLPPLSSVVETTSAYEDSVVLNLGARNLGINTNAELGVEVKTTSDTVSADIVVDTVEKHANGFFPYKSGTTKFTQTEYETMSATIFREDV